MLTTDDYQITIRNFSKDIIANVMIEGRIRALHNTIHEYVVSRIESLNKFYFGDDDHDHSYYQWHTLYGKCKEFSSEYVIDIFTDIRTGQIVKYDLFEHLNRDHILEISSLYKKYLGEGSTDQETWNNTGIYTDHYSDYVNLLGCKAKYPSANVSPDVLFTSEFRTVIPRWDTSAVDSNVKILVFETISPFSALFHDEFKDTLHSKYDYFKKYPMAVHHFLQSIDFNIQLLKEYEWEYNFHQPNEYPT